MADRYWVGGTGTWDATTTTNWATATGGAGGASAPTVADNVFFDGNSNTGTSAFTVTMTGSPRCLNFDASAVDGTMTLAGTGGLSVAGSWVNHATLFATGGAATIDFSSNSANTIDTKGISFVQGILFGQTTASTGSWTLSSAFTTTGLLTFTTGTLTTNNFAVSASGIQKGTGTSTLNLGSSAVTLTGTAAINLTTTGLTINAGTSTITCSNTGTTTFNLFNATTFYNVSFTGPNQAVTFNSATTSVNTLVFNNLSFATPTAVGRKIISFYSGCSCTVNGTLTIPAGADLRYRTTFGVSSTTQSQMTFTCNTYSIDNVDFVNCAVSGTTASGTSIGDAGGNNSNITFTTPKTVYWQGSTGGGIGTGSYATSSGGSASVANFPLPQDTLIIGDTGLNSGATISFSTSYYLPSIDASTRTLPMTIALGTTSSFLCGDYILSSAVTHTSTTGGFAFQTIGSNKTNNISIGLGTNGTLSIFTFIINAYNNGTIKLLRNIIHNSANNLPLSHIRGTLNLNGFNLITRYYQVTTVVGTIAPTILAFGSGGILSTQVSQSSAIILNNTNTSWSYTGTGTIQGYTSSTSAFTILTSAGQSLPKIGLNGTASVTLTTNCTIDDAVVVTSGVACTLTLTSGITVTVNNFTLTGTSGFLATVKSSTAGSFATMTKSGGTTNSNYLSIQDIHATGGATWYAGVNSTNVSGNSGWSFTTNPNVGTFNPGFLYFFDY